MTLTQRRSEGRHVREALDVAILKARFNKFLALPKLQNISSFTQDSVLINDWLVGKSVSLKTIGEQSDSEFV